MFSRKQIYQPKILDLNAVLSAIWKTCSRGCSARHIALEIQLPAQLAVHRRRHRHGRADCDEPGRQRPRRHAQGGTLLIATSAAEISAALARQHPEARAGPVRLFDASGTPAAAWTTRYCSGFSNHFSPPRKWAREPGWDWPPFMALSNNIRAGLKSKANIGAGTTFKVFLPAPAKPGEAPAANR